MHNLPGSPIECDTTSPQVSSVKVSDDKSTGWQSEGGIFKSESSTKGGHIRVDVASAVSNLGQRMDFMDCLARIGKEYTRVVAENAQLASEVGLSRQLTGSSLEEIAGEALKHQSEGGTSHTTSHLRESKETRSHSGGPRPMVTAPLRSSSKNVSSTASGNGVSLGLATSGPVVPLAPSLSASSVPVKAARSGVEHVLDVGGSENFSVVKSSNSLRPNALSSLSMQSQTQPRTDSLGRAKSLTALSEDEDEKKEDLPLRKEISPQAQKTGSGSTKEAPARTTRPFSVFGIFSADAALSKPADGRLSFGSRTTLVNMQQWANRRSSRHSQAGGCCPRRFSIGTLHPQGRFMLIWRPCLFMAVLFAVVMTPFELGFGFWSPPVVYKIIGKCLDFLFLIDVGLCFNVAYAQGDTLVTDRRHIVNHYLKSSFFPDLISSFPYDWFVGQSGKSRKLMKVLKLPKVLRFVKLLDLVKYQTEYLGALSSWCGLLLLSHYFACAWGWIMLGDCEYACPHVGETYLEAFAVSVGGLSGMDSWTRLVDPSGSSRLTSTWNAGDQLPASVDLITFLMMMSGIVLISSFFGSVAFAIFGRNEVARNRSLMRVRRDHEMKLAHVPKELQEKAHATYEYIWRSSGADHNEMINDPNLSLDLRRDLALWIYGPSLRKVPGLRNVPDIRLKCLAQHCTQRLYSPGDLLVMFGDVGEELFLLQSGSVRPLFENGEQIKDVVLYGGAFFGEMCFLRPGSRRTASMQAMDFCRCIVLTLASFTENELHNAVKSISDNACGAGTFTTVKNNTGPPPAPEAPTSKH